MDDRFGGALRAQGLLWVADCPGNAIDVHVSGSDMRIGGEMPWLAAIPEEEWGEEEESIKAELVAKGRWDEKNGDRRSHLFCVGQAHVGGRRLRRPCQHGEPRK